ncbi:MAG TPA: FeoA family protein [Anaerolineales bacterium]|nr:FeoA family protein [Anaerolineales bacterium]HNN12717.1 FeoA family protein [Anaerolineales bacterium]HNO30861.1 FeoA family protein [Anaerolineales bacterium]
MTLLDIPIGGNARLIKTSEGLRSKLRQYGLHIGDCIQVLRAAPLGGPLLVRVNGREVALGREVAAKMLVESECASH